MKKLTILENEIVVVASSANLRLGYLLRRIRDDVLFPDKGFEKFSAYCEAMKEKFSFGYRSANRKIQFVEGYDIISSIPTVKDLPADYMPLRYVKFFPKNIKSEDVVKNIQSIWLEAVNITGTDKPANDVLRNLLEQWKEEREVSHNEPEENEGAAESETEDDTEQNDSDAVPSGIQFTGASEPDEPDTINNDNKLDYIIENSNNNPDKLLALVSANYHRPEFCFTDDEKCILLNIFDMWQEEQRINMEKIFILSHTA
jgi:hypothetical protein